MDWAFDRIIALLVACAALCTGLPAGQEESANSPGEPTVPSTGGLPPLQIGDEPLQPFEPETPEPEGSDRLRDARAWYMTGKIHEARGDGDPDEYEKAAEAYRRAIELNPRALRAYEALIPVLYARDQRQEARDYALQAARETPQGLRIVRGLAAVMAGGDSLKDAVALLQEAVQIEGLDPAALPYLLAQRDLGLYLHMNERPTEAAEAYRVVFDALHGEQASALSEAERAELLGDPGTTYDEFGKTFLEAKLPDLAVKAFDEAAKYRTSRPGIHSFNLALVFRETGKPEQALTELEKYLDAQLQSKGREAYQLLKDLLTDLKRADELVPRLEQLLERDPRNPFLAYFLADEYTEHGDLEKAQALYEKTLGSSTDPRGLVGLLPVYRQQRKAGELIKVLGKLYPQIPELDSPEELQKLPPDARNLVERYNEELAKLAEDSEALDALMKVGREREAANPPEIELTEAYSLAKLAAEAKRTDDVRQFYRLTMSMLNQPQPLLKVYQEYGTYLTDQKEYEEAAKVFREGADHAGLQPVRWVLLFLLSYPLELSGRTDEALAAIAEARGSQPDNPRLHFQQAWIHYHAEQWDKAEPLFKEIIEEYQQDPEQKQLVRDAQFSLSNLYVQQGDRDRGEQILLDVLKAAPDDPQANNDLGYLWADANKNLDQALTMIEKALKSEPDNSAYLDSMGWVLYRLGRYEEALKYLEKAVQNPRGEDSTILDHLGDVLDKLGRREEAAKTWHKALEVERAKARPDAELLQKIEAKLPTDAVAGETGASTP